MVNDPTSLNNLKTKIDDLDVCRLKIVPVDLKKIKWCSEQKKLSKTQNSTCSYESK